MDGALILPTDTPARFAAAVTAAVEHLRQGGVVALPTETVYGLAASALDPVAVARIYEIKGRPAHNPIIVHVCSEEMARGCAAKWPPAARKLASAFWPGPLTVVVPKAGHIPDIVTAGGGTVGLRWPAHAVIQAVIRACGFPLAAPSANPSNQLSPTTAEHVRRSLGSRLSLIVDGGPANVGIESTVVDVTPPRPRVLRPGMIHEPALQAVLGKLASGPGEAGALRSPGLLRKHYSPQARLAVLAWETEDELRRTMAARGWPPAQTHVVAHTRVPLGEGWGGVSVIPRDAAAFARALYGELHRCDTAGARWIVVEAVPDAPEWQAVADRLRRAGAE